MALNAILPYLEGVFDGLTVPGGVGTLHASVTPAAIQPLDGPKAYLLPATMHGRRRTAPRVLGDIELEWWVDVYLDFETNPNAANLNQQFALIVDAILYAAWGTAMPIFVTDPTTGRQTRIVAIGEEVELENPPVKTPATLRSLLYQALLRIQVKEWVQA